MLHCLCSLLLTFCPGLRDPTIRILLGHHSLELAMSTTIRCLSRDARTRSLSMWIFMVLQEGCHQEESTALTNFLTSPWSAWSWVAAAPPTASASAGVATWSWVAPASPTACASATVATGSTATFAAAAALVPGLLHHLSPTPSSLPPASSPVPYTILGRPFACKSSSQRPGCSRCLYAP